MIKKKWFLYITEFFSGMSVMAVELGASRLLAPYFSSSQIVWTLIIGTIMIAMALGNVLGGRLADKKPNADRLYLSIAIAAIWIICIPFVGKYVIAAISFLLALFVKNGFLIWASLISCLLIFVFPLLILGTVTPSIIKYGVDDLDKSGKTAGYLGALNTIGSIIGTFLPTFVTIPTVGTALTFVIFAVILFALSAIYFIAQKKHLVKMSIFLAIIILFTVLNCFFNFSFWSDKIVYQTESMYNYIQVEEDDDYLYLSTNILFGIQSVKVKDEGLSGLYYDYAMAAPLMAKFSEKDNPNVLILGFGSGTYATMLKYYFPNCNVEGVEIDRKIANLSYDTFGVPSDVKLVVNDGRAYIQDKHNTKKYDLIMVDAYQDVTIPFQMSSVEFFKLVNEHLTDDGVMVVNMNMFNENGGKINEYLCDTIHSVFPYVYKAPITNSTNTELFATKCSEPFEYFNDLYVSNHELRYVKNKVLGKLEAVEAGNNIFTDDKAPVELLGMEVLDDMIKDELESLKEQIKGKTLKELLDMLK